MKIDWEAYRAKLKPTPDADALCLYRPCYVVGEDKGTFSPGRGYTSYHAEPRPVCITRHCHGCPAGPRDADNCSLRPVPDLVLLGDAMVRRSNSRKAADRRWLREAIGLMLKYLGALRAD